MRLEQEKYRLIDDYLKNKLSGNDLHEFEQRLKIDSELLEELNEQKLANDLIIENRFFKVVDSFDFAAAPPKAPISTIVKTVLGVVSAGIAILTGYYLLQDPEKETQKSESSSVVVSEPKKETKPEVIAKEEKVETLSEITPTTENLNDKEFIQQPVEEKLAKKEKLKAAKKEEKEKADETYMLEIPLDGHGNEVFSFNPASGESWIIPLYGKKSADLKILDKTGKEVFRTKIVNGAPKFWKGNDANGNKLDAGNYSYVLDFGQGEVGHGHINIISKR